MVQGNPQADGVGGCPNRTDEHGSPVDSMELPGPSDYPVTVGVCSGEGEHGDYLSLVLRGPFPKLDASLDESVHSFSSLRSAICNSFYGEPNPGILQKQSHGRGGYESHYAGPDGIEYSERGVSERDKVSGDTGRDEWECLLVLKGKAFEWVGLDNIADFQGWCHDHGVRTKCTRLDMAWDAPGFTMDDVLAALTREVRNIKTKAMYMGPMSSGKYPCSGPIDDEDMRDSRTFYIGNTHESPRALRFYDKRGFVRMEFVLRRKRAQMAYDYCITSPEGKIRSSRVGRTIMMGLLLDYVDFVDRSDGGTGERLPWWDDFIQEVQPVRYLIPRPVRTLERSKAYVEKSVSASLAFVCAGIEKAGGSVTQWLETLRTRGMERLKSWQIAALESVPSADYPPGAA